MPEQNTDNILQNVNKRDIKRNTSNQIVSYTLEDDSNFEYGIHKVEGVAQRYDKEVYSRALDTLSDELIVDLPDVPLETIQFNYVDESNLYVNGQANEVDDVFEDIFSGRYELTNGARTHKGWTDTHTINPTFFNSDTQAAGFSFQGYDVIPFDKTVFGPGLEEGGYRITKELIESGKNLRFQVKIGVANESSFGESQNFHLSFNRKRKPNDVRTTFAEEFISVGSPQYPFIQTTYDLMNNQMVEHDIWEVQAKVTAYQKVFLYGNKAVFNVEVFGDEISATNWGPNGNVGNDDFSNVPPPQFPMGSTR
jgi:hypothetical protein